MRVLINALGATMGGALRHLTNFLPALARTSTSYHYDVMMRSSVPVLAQSDHVRLLRCPDKRAASSLHRVVDDLIASSFRARRYDVLVSLMNFGPVLCPIPHVLFQRNALYYSERYRASLTGSSRLELALRRRWTIESMRFATLVVTPTQAMADMIREDCPELQGANFQTLYHGFDTASTYTNDVGRSEPAVSGHPKLVYTAHLGRYKNFELLFHALRLLKAAYPSIKLILTFGPEDHASDFEYYKRMARDLGVQENVMFAGRVRQDEMGPLYRSADLFVFPSICESFGFPLLEAMDAGLPIVASNIPSNRELCGDAALYFDADDARMCTEQIRAVLEHPSRGTTLSRRAADLLNRFDWSWARYAREFTAIVEHSALRKFAA